MSKETMKQEQGWTPERIAGMARLKDAQDKKLALPKQEQGGPVGWPCVIETADFEEDIVTLKMQAKDYSVGVGLHWLSTTPQQRKPLTDEAIATVYWGATGQSLRPQDNVLAHKFARAIEAAHGIKE